MKEHEPMGRHTNFRIGGPARYFAEAKSERDIVDAIAFAEEKALPYFILGGGSNTLVADDGFDGVVIKMAMRELSIDATRVTAEAGVLSAALARATARAGLKGLGWMISLPGTVGGAVRGNAGCFGGETKDRLVSVRLLQDGIVHDVPASELRMGYRDSALKHAPGVVLSAEFVLEPGNPEALEAELAETIAKRKATQPLHAGSAGCLFKNYEATEADVQRIGKEYDIPAEMVQARRLGAGWIIDQLGMKGAREGDAQVSLEHGNFLVNLGNATARDIAALAHRVKREAREQFGIELEEEVQYLGF